MLHHAKCQIEACMLTKNELSVNRITNMLDYNSSVLRLCICNKIFKKKADVGVILESVMQF